MTRRMKRTLALTLLAATLSAGCETTRPIPPGHEPVPEIVGRFETSTAFLEPGRTTRSEVEARWGAPTLRLQSGRIACYAFQLLEDVRMSHMERGWTTNTFHFAARPVFTVLQPTRVDHANRQVILVFGADGVLEKYQIVKRPAGILYGPKT
jgi:hypothetical protein